MKKKKENHVWFKDEKGTQDNLSVLTKNKSWELFFLHGPWNQFHWLQNQDIICRPLAFTDLLINSIFKFFINTIFYFNFNFWPHHEKILVPGPGIELSPLQWKYRLLTTEPPEKSLQHTYWEQWFPIFSSWGEGVTSKTQNMTKQLSLNARQSAP